MTIVNKVGVGNTWFCEYICPSGMLFGGIPLVIANPEMRGSIGLRFYWELFLLLFIILLSIKSYRPFCKYICPLGALYGCGNKVSLYRLKVDKEKCVECGACQNVCGMDIKVWQNPNSMYSIFITGGTSILVNSIKIIAYGGGAHVLYGEIFATIFAVAAYFVIKIGTVKSKIRQSS